MNHKKIFLNRVLKYLIEMYNFSSLEFLGQSLYENLPFGNNDSSYLIIPRFYIINDGSYMHNYKKVYENFNPNDIDNKDFIKSIENNIWRYFDNISDTYSFSDGSLVSTVDIDNKRFKDKKDENNLNAELFSIREACEQERNNEYKVIKYDDIYISSSKNNFNRNVIFISKKIIVDIIINQFNNIMKLPSENNFNLLLIQEFINKMKNNKKSS